MKLIGETAILMGDMLTARGKQSPMSHSVPPRRSVSLRRKVLAHQDVKARGEVAPYPLLPGAVETFHSKLAAVSLALDLETRFAKQPAEFVYRGEAASLRDRRPRHG